MSDEKSNQRPKFNSELAARIYKTIIPSPMCRDCADTSEDGRCPRDGEMCDTIERARELAELVDEAVTDQIRLNEVKDYLWPNQTGLPNRHRNALTSIKARIEPQGEEYEECSVCGCTNGICMHL